MLIYLNYISYIILFLTYGGLYDNLDENADEIKSRLLAGIYHHDAEA